MTTLATDEAKKIIAALNGIPPSEIEEYLEEEDQRRHYQVVRAHYSSIRDYLAAYFTGSPKPDFGKLQELYEAFFHYYLKLYDLIFHTWNSLSEAAIAEGLSIPGSPSELLIEILGSEADGMMAICYSNHRSISVKKARSLLSPSNPVDLESPMKELSSKAKQRRNYYKQNAIEGIGNDWINLLKGLANRRKQTRIYSRELDRAWGDVQTVLRSYTHPRKGLVGGVWRNGKWHPNA
jgi:hypothetical protein